MASVASMPPTPWLLATLLVLAAAAHARQISSSSLHVTVEYATAPLALESLAPRFSWEIPTEGSQRGEVQTSYAIAVARSAADLSTALANSEPVVSNHSVLRRPVGVRLERGALYYAQVAVNTTQRSQLTAGSPVLLGTAPSAAEFSKAKFVGHFSSPNSSCPWLRKDMASPPADWAPPGKAIAYVASVGYHEIHVNGVKVTADCLSPSVSDLAKRALVRAYDISNWLQPGRPYTIGLWLAPGWAQFGSRTRLQASNIFNTTKAPLAKALVRFYSAEDLHLMASVVTDESWKARMSSVQHIGLWQNGNFGGDWYNASADLEGWASPSITLDSDWKPAHAYPSASSSSERVLSTDIAEPNRLRETVPPKSMEWDADVLVVEMARVFVGWLELQNLSGQPRATVIINVSTVPWCSPQTDKCIKGGGSHPVEFGMQHRYTFGASGSGGRFIPRFSYHEVKHVAITGLAIGSQPRVIGHRIGNIGRLTAVRSGTTLSGGGQ